MANRRSYRRRGEATFRIALNACKARCPSSQPDTAGSPIRHRSRDAATHSDRLNVDPDAATWARSTCLPATGSRPGPAPNGAKWQQTRSKVTRSGSCHGPARKRFPIQEFSRADDQTLGLTPVHDGANTLKRLSIAGDGVAGRSTIPWRHQMKKQGTSKPCRYPLGAMPLMRRLTRTAAPTIPLIRRKRKGREACTTINRTRRHPGLLSNAGTAIHADVSRPPYASTDSRAAPTSQS